MKNSFTPDNWNQKKTKYETLDPNPDGPLAIKK